MEGMIGQSLGRYKITSLLGEGGMGAVFRAEDATLQRDVAIKVMHHQFASQPNFQERFLQEARTAAKMDHPGIVPVYEVGELDGRHYFTMGFVNGASLANKLKDGPLPPRDAAELTRHVAEAVVFAHQRGVIHRDLKPANIKIGPDEKPKILDFGLAKAFGAEFSRDASAESPTVTRQRTEVGVILGTAAYMSPEQARGAHLDKATDIWSYGCCLCEALTRKPPFSCETLSDTIAAVLKNEPDWSTLPAT